MLDQNPRKKQYCLVNYTGGFLLTMGSKTNLDRDFDYFFMFIPNLGEMIQFDEHIFQIGVGNNHHLPLDPNNPWKNEGWKKTLTNMGQKAPKNEGNLLGLFIRGNPWGNYKVGPYQL